MSHRHWRDGLTALAVGIGMIWPLAPAGAQDAGAQDSSAALIEALRRQVDSLQRRLEAMEARERSRAAPRETARTAAARPAPEAPPRPAATAPGPAAPSQAASGPAPGATRAPPPVATASGAAAPAPAPPSAGTAVVQAPAGSAAQGPVPSQGAQQPPPELAATLGSMPGSLRIPGTGTSVRLYGFAVGQMLIDGGARNRSDVVTAQSIPLSPGAAARQGGEVLFSARRSRLGIETSTDTDWGPLHTVVEMDFAGAQSTASLQSQSSSNSYIPRLRHAYGELGPVLIGQTWSLFFDENYPQRLDNATPFAVSNVRQAQFRYTQKFAHGLSLAASFEQPYTDLTFSGGVRYADMDTGSAPPLTLDKAPDVLARLRWEDADFGSLALTGLVRPQMTASNDGDFVAANRYRASATGWGVQLSGMAKVFERDRVYLRFAYGQGIGRYLDSTANGQGSVSNAGLAGVAPDAVRMDEVPLVAALLGYTHFWTDTLRSNATMGWASLSYPAYARQFAAGGAALLNKDIGQGVLNLIWSPVPRVDLGLEYLGTTRTLLRGLPAGAGTEGAKGGVSHRVVLSGLFRF
ncbi:DcaP family trimeric outer membrane transporter [Roseicella frigidaeris]|uniref:Porin n=1 Tax=Roseicella frigidaeris TaxID=2230885 RepID=A0A327M524_9PROT|nr:DcaP family trimeric outer membrane transporter [Roseicella frigidaeris]RAI58371.1 porin [Roseicella frigidaeris]